MIIRFRAWDKKEKRWCHETEVNIEASTPSSPAGPTYWHLHHDAGGNEVKMLGCPDIEVSLSTGLKDKKNDKEIFEGDIVRHQNGFLYVVEQDTVNAWWCLVQVRPRVPYTGGINGQEIWRCEVIGNRWENPEMIP